MEEEKEENDSKQYRGDMFFHECGWVIGKIYGVFCVLRTLVLIIEDIFVPIFRICLDIIFDIVI